MALFGQQRPISDLTPL